MDRWTTTGEWLNEWLVLRAGQLRPRTVERYGELIRLHAAPLEGIRLRRLRAADIQPVLMAICARGHTRTAEQLYVLMRASMRVAMERRRIKTDPMQGVIRPAHKAKQGRTWTPAQQKAIKTALTGTVHELPILIGLMCGLRRGEICGLRWSDIEAGTIHVRSQRVRLADGSYADMPPKTAAGVRDIPIPEALRFLVAAQRQIGGYLTSLSPSGLSQALQRASDAAGVPRIGIHGLRHTMATNAVRAGISMRVLQVILGHSDYRVTAKVYTHPDAEMLQTAVDAAARFVV